MKKNVSYAVAKIIYFLDALIILQRDAVVTRNKVNSKKDHKFILI